MLSHVVICGEEAHLPRRDQHWSLKSSGLRSPGDCFLLELLELGFCLEQILEFFLDFDFPSVRWKWLDSLRKSLTSNYVASVRSELGLPHTMAASEQCDSHGDSEQGREGETAIKVSKGMAETNKMSHLHATFCLFQPVQKPRCKGLEPRCPISECRLSKNLKPSSILHKKIMQYLILLMMKLHLKVIKQNLLILRKITGQSRSTILRKEIWETVETDFLRKVRSYLKASASSHFKEGYFIPFLSPQNFMRIWLDKINDLWAKCQEKWLKEDKGVEYLNLAENREVVLLSICCKCLGISSRPSADETKERWMDDGQHHFLEKKPRRAKKAGEITNPFMWKSRGEKTEVRLNPGTGRTFASGVLKYS